MSTVLDPTVSRKLRQFGRRRFQLLALRGLCAGIVAFVICMAIVAAIDWYRVLTDNARWCLSVAAYTFSGLAVYLTSLKKIVRQPPREELAAHVESAEPILRENLLSAVELATDNPDSVRDSPVFRSLLQGKVAEQMTQVRIGRLLPFRLLGKWLLAAVIVGLGIAALLKGPDARFRTLALRAILPGANIARVSRIQVEILQPSPASLTVAKDETIAVIAKISGGDVDDVTLETQLPDGSTRSQLMRPRESNKFAANIHVTHPLTNYRILAGDAITKRHTITAIDRPRVLEFQKTFHYPEYAELPDQTVTHDHGDILVLAQTQTQLQLKLNQPVSTAELHLTKNDAQNSDAVTTIPLTQAETSSVDNNLWQVNLPIDAQAIYKIHLVAAETEFENQFARRFEIRPIPDLIPRAGFVNQTQTSLLLPPNDILALQGMAEDDLPFNQLVQEYSINGQEWQTLPLDTVPDTENEGEKQTDAAAIERHRIKAAWEWDLAQLQLERGDQITTRLVAIDRKGNRGESVPLRIVVSSADFDPQRHLVMHRKAALYDSIARLKDIAEEDKKAASAIIKELQKSAKSMKDEESPDWDLQQSQLIRLTAKLGEATQNILNEVHAVSRTMPAGSDAYDLDLAGRTLARLQQDRISSAEFYVRQFPNQPDKSQTLKDLEETKRAFDRIADDAKGLEFHFRNLATHNIAVAAAVDFEALYQQQKMIVDSPTQTWNRLLRHETLVIKQLENIEQLLEQQQPRLKDHLRNRFRSLLTHLQKRRRELEDATESADKLPELQRLGKTLLNEFAGYRRIDVEDGSLAERLNQARRDLDNRSGSLVEPLSQMTELAVKLNQVAKDSQSAKDSKNSDEFVQRQLRVTTEIAERVQPSLEQLRIRRTLTQARRDADSRFAADAGLTHRAANSLIRELSTAEATDPKVQNAFREIAPAYRILEAGHDMQNVRNCLSTLMSLERWDSQDLSGKTDHPRHWDTINKGLEQAVNKMRRAGISHELMGKFDEVRWCTPQQDANRKITQRRWRRDHLVSASQDLQQLLTRLDDVMVELMPIMADAREKISKYAPTISELAQQAAEEVRELEDQTQQAADEIQQSASDENQSKAETRLAALQEKQQHVNQQIDELMEALVEDANSQDPLDREQAARAQDADNSRRMVQKPAQEMNTALQQAKENQPQQQPASLAQAAEKQEKTAQALDKVAAHFDRLENNLDIADSRAELRDQQQAAMAENQSQPQEADLPGEPQDQLAANAQTPADLLKALEEELQRNPAMQQALSEISEKTVQEAANALQAAAEREQDIQRSNEQADKSFQQKKRDFAQQLRELGRETNMLANRLVAQANSASSQARTPEAQKQFQQTQKQLNEAGRAASSANENDLQMQLANKLATAKAAVAEARKALQSGKDKSAAAKKTEIHKEEKDRKKAVQDLEKRHKNFINQLKRDADQVTRQAQSVERQANQQVRNAENNKRNMERQVQQAKKNLSRKPDDKNLKRNVEQAEQRRKAAEEKVAAAKKRYAETKRATAATRKAKSAIDKQKKPSLKEKNPAAQLAESYAQQALDSAEDLDKKLADLEQASDFSDELTLPQQQLANAAKQQRDVTKSVEDSAEKIARAARHEQRLEKPIVASALEQAATNVEQVAKNEATDAQQKLEAAGQAKSDQPNADKDGKNAEGKPQAPSDSAPVIAANEALSQAEQAIAQQAKALRGIPTSQESPSEQAASEQASAAQPNGTQPNGTQPNGTQFVAGFTINAIRPKRC